MTSKIRLWRTEAVLDPCLPPLEWSHDRLAQVWDAMSPGSAPDWKSLVVHPPEGPFDILALSTRKKEIKFKCDQAVEAVVGAFPVARIADFNTGDKIPPPPSPAYLQVDEVSKARVRAHYVVFAR